jgi:hypothetical protein
VSKASPVLVAGRSCQETVVRNSTSWPVHVLTARPIRLARPRPTDPDSPGCQGWGDAFVMPHRSLSRRPAGPTAYPVADRRGQDWVQSEPFRLPSLARNLSLVHSTSQH